MSLAKMGANIGDKKFGSFKTNGDDAKNLMQWIENQPHLPRIDGLETKVFLHACYYDIECAKRAIDTYFTFRTTYPELFNVDLNCDRLRKTLDITLISTLPQRTPEDHTVIYVKFVNPDPRNYDENSHLKLLDMVVSLDTHLEPFPEGHHILIDADGIALGHLTRTNVLKVKRFIDYLQDGIPMRLKGIHLVNMSPFRQKLVDLLKNLMKSEIRNLIHVHAAPYDTLDPYIPKNCIPADSGGTGTVTVAELLNHIKQKIYSNADYFAKQQDKRVDESKRPRTKGWFGGFWG